MYMYMYTVNYWVMYWLTEVYKELPNHKCVHIKKSNYAISMYMYMYNYLFSIYEMQVWLKQMQETLFITVTVFIGQ